MTVSIGPKNPGRAYSPGNAPGAVQWSAFGVSQTIFVVISPAGLSALYYSIATIRTERILLVDLGLKGQSRPVGLLPAKGLVIRCRTGDGSRWRRKVSSCSTQRAMRSMPAANETYEMKTAADVLATMPGDVVKPADVPGVGR
jgi:hypothetical protein